ncbi:MAG TPA: hypothetical protein VKZ53_02085 [Candidatus Angelobacter sp.]|nr:hypothetical protein [Candidatus Angelobacter sp.]
MSNYSTLAAKLREVLKDHQRDGLNMIGNVDKLVVSLVHAVEDWTNEETSLSAKKSA